MAKGESPLNSSDDKNLKYIPIDDSNEKEQFYDKLLFVISAISIFLIITVAVDRFIYVLFWYMQSKYVKVELDYFRREKFIYIINCFLKAIAMGHIFYRVTPTPKNKSGDVINKNIVSQAVWIVVLIMSNIISFQIVPKSLELPQIIYQYRITGVIFCALATVFNLVSFHTVYRKKSMPYMGVDKKFSTIVTICLVIAIWGINIIIPVFIQANT